jgi:hypothetical protein
MYFPTAVLVESLFEKRKRPVEVASTLPILERLVLVASRLVSVTRRRGRKWLPVIVIALPGLTKGGFTVIFGAGVMLPANPAETRTAKAANRRAQNRRTPAVISVRGGNRNIVPRRPQSSSRIGRTGSRGDRSPDHFPGSTPGNDFPQK